MIYLFIDWGLSSNDKNTIENGLEELLTPHIDKIGIKKAEKHKWLIKIENVPKKYGIDIASYYINVLLKCLTYNFGSEVTKIEILEQDDWHDTKIIVPFDYLFYRSFVVKESKYKHNSDVFNFYSFSKDEWKNIFNNLFKNDKVLESFFNIIVQNHLERYIDCIASIGKTKQYNKTKYQDVLKDFIRDFDSDIQKALISFFKKSLRTVKANPSKDDWVLIGQKIANLRALTTHFDESSKPVNMAKYTNLYFIFELVVIDYIFEVLDISKDKRLSYKEKYIKPFLK